jgi:nucleoside-diphosphate-sugar epimerase
MHTLTTNMLTSTFLSSKYIPYLFSSSRLIYHSVDGNQHVLDSAAKAGSVRAIVYTSSGPIIAGTGAGYDHADETQPTLAWPTIRKGDPYHLAKALGERKILEADGQHGIRTACIRPTALYGGELSISYFSRQYLKSSEDLSLAISHNSRTDYRF